MNRRRCRSLRVLPVALVVLGCGDTDAGSKTDGASGGTSVASTAGEPDDNGSTGAPGGSGGDGSGSSTGPASTTSGDITAGPDVESEGGASDPGGSTAGDTSGTGGPGDEAGDTTGAAGGTTGEDDGPSFVASVWPILDEECGCHQDSNGAGKLRLAEEDAYANLVDMPSNQLPSMLLVKPGSSEESYLWHKLNDTHKSVGGEGKRMPPSGLLDADVLDVVKQWIDQGAAP